MKTFHVEAPLVLEEGGRQMYCMGRVELGGRWPRVSNFRVFDQRTDEELELEEDWAREKADEVLVEAARELWEKP